MLFRFLFASVCLFVCFTGLVLGYWVNWSAGEPTSQPSRRLRVRRIHSYRKRRSKGVAASEHGVRPVLDKLWTGSVERFF
jgi:hypothetical protein